MSSIAPSQRTLPQLSSDLPNDSPNRVKNSPLLAPTERKIDPAIQASAQGMEGMFLDHLMTVMRKTVPKSDLSLNSNAVEIYQSMLDSEIAHQAAHSNGGGVGLAAQIIEYLRQTGYPIYETSRQEPRRRQD